MLDDELHVAPRTLPAANTEIETVQMRHDMSARLTAAHCIYL
jgi:hypothetical protein